MSVNTQRSTPCVQCSSAGPYSPDVGCRPLDGGRARKHACAERARRWVIACFVAFVAACPAPVNAAELPGNLGIEAHGFVDGRGGIRTQDDPDEKDTSLGELRLQLSLERLGDLTSVQVRSDFLYDDIPGDHEIDLEAGAGWIDLREAWLLASPLDFMDVKLGRQILTWGTGDMLFINDLFPKDWPSFFSGRDEEYLKAPSDALFISLFPGFANVDLAWSPRFDSDRYITGERISYWNPMLDGKAGRGSAGHVDKPEDWGDDGELAARVSRNTGGYELAVYGYAGFWKTPEGIHTNTMTPFFPELSVYGASVRGPLGKGLVNLETGYYDSDEDTGPNSQVRGLLGYERELVKNVSLSFQYYLEHMLDYAVYVEAVQKGQSAKDEDRQVATVRLTARTLSQTLTLSLFAYYSQTDRDAYLRPIAKYKLTDAWMLTAGANIFLGEKEYTFFGQFQDNNNVYAGARYSF